MSVPSQKLAQAWQLHMQGQHGPAEQMYRELLREHPGQVQILTRLTLLLRQTQRVQEAFKLLEPMATKPGAHPGFVVEYAMCLCMSGQFDQSIDALKTLAKAHPGDVQVRIALAQVFSAAGKDRDAVAVLKEAAFLDPKNPDPLFLMGMALISDAKPNHALEPLRKAAAMRPDDPRIKMGLGKALHAMNQTDEAETLLRDAATAQPNDGDAAHLYVSLLYAQGKPEEAEQFIETKLRSGLTHPAIMVAGAQMKRRQKNPAAAVDLLRTMFAQPNVLPNWRAPAQCELGGALEELGEYDEAFKAYEEGNRLLGYRYNAAYQEQMFDATIRIFTRERIEKLRQELPDSAKAIFILGMPRSGTTLTEQILAAHPEVTPGGELAYLGQFCNNLPAMLKVRVPFPKCAEYLTPLAISTVGKGYLENLRRHGSKSDHITDKMPANFLNIGMIAMALPQATMIHCCRHPADTCMSIFATPLQPSHPYSTDLKSLAHYYGLYRRLMDHWREVLDIPMFEARYREFIADAETKSRELIDFCGLEWDDACLQFHKAKRTVSTASVHQVRQPIYRSSLARWKRFEDHLGPLLDGLKPFLEGE